MKKILFIADSLKSGGVEKSLLYIVNNLTNNGYMVDLMTLNGDLCNMKNVNNIKLNRKIFPFFNSIKNQIKSLNLNFILTLFICLLKSLFNNNYTKLPIGNRIRYTIIDKYIEIEKEYDIAIAFNISHLLYVLDTKVTSNKKIAWFHGDASDKKINISSYINILNKMDKIICVSEKSKYSLKEYIDLKNVEVIKNFVYINDKFEDEKNPFNKNEYNIVTIGRLNKEKNYFNLIKHIKKYFNNNFENIHLYIIGNGPEYKKIKKYIKRNNIEDKISLLGMLDNPDYYLYYSDLFIHPSKYEGFGLSIYEAAFMGKKVICYDVSDVKKDSKDLKNIFVANDEIDFINKIKEIKNISEKNQKDYMKKLDIHNKKVEEKLNKLFDEIDQKNVKTIYNLTYHSASNYGAVLQTYALQNHITKIFKKNNINIDYKIINYISDKRNIEENPYSNILKKIIKKIILKNGIEKKQKKFKKFRENYLKLSKKVTNTNELQQLTADYYMVGSDQVWNTNLNVFDSSYLLDFVKSGKKISYAASCGVKKEKINGDYKNIVIKNINEFSNISVRDEYSKKFIKKILNKDTDISINIDPTLLLDKNEWSLMANSVDRVVKDDYIFVYLIVYSSNEELVEYYNYIQNFAKKNNLKVVIVLPNLKVDYKFNFIKKYDSGPLEFLNLIYNAKYVFSTSFHGTVFSLIFNKKFYCFNANKDERIRSLLNHSNLMSQDISVKNDIYKLNDEISYEEFYKYVNKEIINSDKYLLDSFEISEK